MIDKVFIVGFIVLSFYSFGQDTDSTKRIKFLPVPSIGYSPETRYYLGAVVLSTFSMDKHSRSSNAKIEFVYTWNQQMILDQEWNVFARKDRLFTQGLLHFSKYPDTYFGIGSDQQEEDAISYQSKRFKLDGMLLWKPRDNWYSLQWLDRAQAQAMEPALECIAALFSPSTGIIDSHALMLSYLGDFENAGGMLALNSQFLSAQVLHEAGQTQFIVRTADGTELLADQVINSTGLIAPQVARQFAGSNLAQLPLAYYAKGNYFVLSVLAIARSARLAWAITVTSSQSLTEVWCSGALGRLSTPFGICVLQSQ